jgi:two-component system, NarL family, sensor kinase
MAAMSGSIPTGLARGLAAAAAVLDVAAAAVAFRYRLDAAGVGLALLVIACTSIALVGSAVASAEPRNPLGWLLLVCGASIPLAVGSFVYSHAAIDHHARLSGASWAAWLDGWPWTPALVVVPTVGLLLFPDGHARSGRWRWLLWAAWFVLAAQLLNELFAPHLLDYPHRHNPTALPGAAGSIADGLGATIVAVPVISTLAAWSVHQRFRRAGSDAERAALRIVAPAGWLIAASWWSCGAVILLTGNSDDATIPELSGVAVLAVTAWVATRRYGLFNTRQVINRGLVYTALSGIVLGIYLAAAALVDLIATNAVGAAVAAVAAVLGALPLRVGLQRAADRLVYGLRGDPYAALEQLGHRLAAAVEPEAVLPDVVASIRHALRLPYVRLEMTHSVVESGGAVSGGEAFRLIFAGEQVGTLLVGHRGSEPEFTPSERRLLAALASQLASATHAVSLVDDLRSSRERLVSATEEERRRIRRDLHDSVGPGLAGVVLGLHRARRQLETDPHSAAQQIEDLSVQTQEAISEVRQLVYDLRPPALDELGLVGALAEQASRFGTITVTVTGPRPMPALSAAAEVAAYRIAVEAMTNVVRHAGAASAAVEISIDGCLQLEIRDTGAGLPQGYRAGVGILSMRERAAELGGVCTIEPGSPRGTIVRASIPLATA